MFAVCCKIVEENIYFGLSYFLFSRCSSCYADTFNAVLEASGKESCPGKERNSDDSPASSDSSLSSREASNGVGLTA